MYLTVEFIMIFLYASTANFVKHYAGIVSTLVSVS